MFNIVAYALKRIKELPVDPPHSKRVESVDNVLHLYCFFSFTYPYN